MELKIKYSKQALKFFIKNKVFLDENKSDSLINKAVRKIILKEDTNVNVNLLKGNLSSYYRIRYRDIRIIFYIDSKGEVIVVFVEGIDFRGNIYKK